MPTLVATVGGSTANSYATVAEAETFFDGRLGVTAWLNADEDDKARALIQATHRIDQEDFVGNPVLPLNDRNTSGSTQALKWPRYWATAPDGWHYDQNQIPTQVQRATMLLALAILSGDFDSTQTGLEGYAEVRVGPLMVKPIAASARPAAVLPDEVSRELRGLLVTESAGQFRIMRA